MTLIPGALSLLFHLASASLIQDISRKNFQNLLHDEEIVLTAFTSKSSDCCTAFNTDFSLAAAEIKSPLVTIDCTEETELCRDYDVNSFPAVRLFRGNTSSRYRGPRTVSAIVSYMTRNELPPVTYVQANEMETFKNIDDVVIVAYLDAQDEELARTFEVVAQTHHHDMVFGTTMDPKVAEKDGGTVPAIGCYKNGVDGDNRVMNGKFDQQTVESFLEMVVPPFIEEFRERSMETFLSSGKLLSYIFVETPAQRKNVRRELTPVAKKFQKYVKFAVVDAKEYNPMARNMGLSEDIFPAFVVHNMRNDEVFSFAMGRDITQRNVDELLMAILKGEAVPGVQEGLEEDEGQVRGRDEL